MCKLLCYIGELSLLSDVLIKFYSHVVQLSTVQPPFFLVGSIKYWI